MNFKQWSEKLRLWLSSFARKRPPGLAALPNQARSYRAGSFRLPVIDWEKIYRKSFLYNSIAVAICAYFVADLAVLALTPYIPAAEAPRPRFAARTDRKDISRYDQIFARNLFNEKGLIPDADVGIDNGPPVRTSLPLTLLGVIVTGNPSKSVASIEDKSANAVLALREGDILGNNTATIQKIETDRVIFLNNSSQRREFVELPKDQILATRRAAPSKPTGGIQQSGNHFTIDRKVVDDAVSPENMPKTLTEARCVPHQQGGRSGGYQCFQIVPGSIYDKLGMKDNDIVTSINGQALDDPSKIFNFLNGLRSAKNISISLMRGGRAVNLEYDIQ